MLTIIYLIWSLYMIVGLKILDYHQSTWKQNYPIYTQVELFNLHFMQIEIFNMCKNYKIAALFISVCSLLWSKIYLIYTQEMLYDFLLSKTYNILWTLKLPLTQFIYEQLLHKSNANSKYLKVTNWPAVKSSGSSLC